MSFNKVGTYTRLSSERDLLDNNSIIYIYGKDLYSINKQKNLISHFCKDCGINPKKTYIDVECKNDFQSKNELNRLLLENNNTNIIIYSTNRLTRSVSDLFDINDICKERNLGIFSVQNNEFIVDKKSILDVVQDIEKEFF